MTGFLSSDPNEFDRQIAEHFEGIGKARTILSGTWRNWMNEACSKVAGWQCEGAWDNGDGEIHFAMKDPSGAISTNAIAKHKVSQKEAARVFAALDYEYRNPFKVLLGVGYEVPNGFMSTALYEELVCRGFEGYTLIDEYERLGGE